MKKDKDLLLKERISPMEEFNNLFNVFSQGFLFDKLFNEEYYNMEEQVLAEMLGFDIVCKKEDELVIKFDEKMDIDGDWNGTYFTSADFDVCEEKDYGSDDWRYFECKFKVGEIWWLRCKK